METKLSLVPDYTPEEMEKLHRQFLEDDRNNPNKLSFWFPKVKDCGINVPKTIVVPVPDEVCDSFFLEREGDSDRIRDFVRDRVMPALDGISGLPFIKNGCYSGKFDFRNCSPAAKDERTLFKSIVNIMQDSLAFCTSGYTEVILRERIPAPENPETIYNGLPLVPEFRFFYDFDRDAVLYAVNYWDWDYCHDAICADEHDKETYERRYPSLQQEHRENVIRIGKAVRSALRKVQGLTGIWSVDILMDGKGNPWLIDMALARQSAYWDPVKAGFAETQGIAAAYINDVKGGMGERMKGRWAELLHGYFCGEKNEYETFVRDSVLDAYFEYRPSERDVFRFIRETAALKDDETRTLDMLEANSRKGILQPLEKSYVNLFFVQGLKGLKRKKD